MEIKVLSLDPSLRNFALVKAKYNGLVEIEDLNLVKTKPNKKLKRGEDDLRCARIIYRELEPAVEWADVVIAEIPVGSQSSRAAWTLGIVLGMLATIPDLIGVSARDVKSAAGSKVASKSVVLNWATNKYPDANWRYYRNKLTRDNEHLADAIGALHAAINKGYL